MTESKVDVLKVMDDTAVMARFDNSWNSLDEADFQAARAALAELIEAHRIALATIDDYLAYEHDGDPWKEDARAMGEMDINDFATDGRLDRCRAALAACTPAKEEGR